uniref:Broad-complex core protein isoform 6 n=1 Tax=Caligus clemensi TaxID=344056 RepID=C1C2N1_CALCM|nr:Broad-complex core protein isoform 6 [Caligus clemensi]
MGSITTECISLRWNNYESNFKESFSELRRSEELFDITLATESHSLRAHKVILSSCSPLFRHLIQSVPSGSRHPLLFLRGIDFKYLESLIDFVYDGEIRLIQEDLDGFLKLAQELKIKGLSQGSTTRDLDTTKEESFESSQVEGRDFEDDMEMENTSLDYVNPLSQDADNYASETQEECPPFDESLEGTSHPSNSEEYIRKLDVEISKLISDKDAHGFYHCNKCKYSTTRRATMQSHCEAMHFITSGFKCDVCQKVLKTRHSRKNHKLKYHKNDPIVLLE